MNIEIINTGSELMLGRVLNTHQQWLCRRLADLGHVVTRQVAVADDGRDIQNAVREALDRADLVIATGGLGPTSDDLTRERIAELLGRRLIHHPEVLAHIQEFFARRGRPRPAKTEVETYAPEGALVFLNQYGTAPGLAMRADQPPEPAAFAAPKWLVLLPGPPRELRPMFDTSIVPLIQREFPSETFICRTLRSTGIGESRVQELIEAALHALAQRGLGIGYCARPGAVDVRLTAAGTGARILVSEGEAVVQGILGAQIYGFDDDEMENAAVRLLTEQKKSVALAESCTGGHIAHRITNVAGASAVFWGGVVSYANSAKEKMLGVRAETLARHGAVSDAVAREMAMGAREAFGADYALGVTGIAGPGGGSADKPVGTVFIALASAAGVEVNRALNSVDRATFKEMTATQALDSLRKRLISNLL